MATNNDTILNAYRKAGERGLTDDEALVAAIVHQNSWRAGRRRLMEADKIVATDRTRLTRTGRLAVVYRINN